MKYEILDKAEISDILMALLYAAFLMNLRFLACNLVLPFFELGNDLA